VGALAFPEEELGREPRCRGPDAEDPDVEAGRLLPSPWLDPGGRLELVGLLLLGP
jgi:hypothetical protein